MVERVPKGEERPGDEYRYGTHWPVIEDDMTFVGMDGNRYTVESHRELGFRACREHGGGSQ